MVGNLILHVQNVQNVLCVFMLLYVYVFSLLLAHADVPE